MKQEVTEVSFGKDQYHLQNTMITWCEENLGPGGWASYTAIGVRNWAVESAFGNTFFYFRDPKDAMMFKLRWS